MGWSRCVAYSAGNSSGPHGPSFGHIEQTFRNFTFFRDFSRLQPYGFLVGFWLGSAGVWLCFSGLVPSSYCCSGSLHLQESCCCSCLLGPRLPSPLSKGQSSSVGTALSGKCNLSYASAAASWHAGCIHYGLVSSAAAPVHAVSPPLWGWIHRFLAFSYTEGSTVIGSENSCLHSFQYVYWPNLIKHLDIQSIVPVEYTLQAVVHILIVIDSSHRHYSSWSPSRSAFNHCASASVRSVLHGFQNLENIIHSTTNL